MEQSNSLTGIGYYYYGYGPSYTSANCAGVTPAPSAGQAVFVAWQEEHVRL